MKSPRYQAHADWDEGHGLAAEQVLGSIVLLRTEEAEIDADEHADAQQTTEEGIIGPSKGKLLQFMFREERVRSIDSGHPDFAGS